MRTICTLLLIASALQAQFRDPDSQSERNPFAGQPDAILAGKKLFATSCSGCHGANAEGGRGPNLMKGRMIRRSSDTVLFTSIKKGVPGTDMPPTNLPDDQIWRRWEEHTSELQSLRHLVCRLLLDKKKK